jgi:ubiquinone/menaquinone biosynthesis C-methylase UbiE
MATTNSVVHPNPVCDSPKIHNSNSEARDATGWSASLYNKTASFVYSPAFTESILQLLATQPGERIIDLGCGSGELTLEIEKNLKEDEGGMIVGVDFSESMVSSLWICDMTAEGFRL